jgi:peptide/nickel transport system substrate-binding protein
MKRLLATAGCALLLAAGAIDAKTLRWASAGDPLTSDPHSQNESFNNLFAELVHGGLVARDKQLRIIPALALSWQQVSTTVWRFNLRKGVKFHDGAPFTADDVVFTIIRSQHANSQQRQYANLLGTPRKIDDFTVELVQEKPNPILLEHLTNIWIMNKAWAVKNKVENPLDFKNKEETNASRSANGTGAWILVSREPGIKTVLRKNPNWWGLAENRFEGNVTELVYTQISSDATRVAALLSGEVDFILDPPPQDLNRLRGSKDVKVIEGQENRVLFFGFDQFRDELAYSNVKGKNPFKDVRVRTAVYHAIDIEALRSRTMRGAALPTGGITPSTLPSSPEIEKRLPHDVNRAKALLTEAGYPDGFEVTLDCPNNRYINDEEICVAVSAMLSRVGIATKVTTLPRVTYFPKLEKFDTSFYMLGWGGAVTDAQTTLSPVLRTLDKASGQGGFNYGRYSNPKLDTLIDAAAIEMNPEKRRQIIWDALKEHNANVHHVPLHRQMIPWAMRPNITVVHRADNWPMPEWIRID